MILANHGIISSSGGLPPSTLLTNLYAVYKAESNANDSLGAYNGTAQGGLTYTAGKSGNAFVGNGTSAFVQMPNNSTNFTGSFSVSMWVNLANVSTSQYLLSNYSGGGANGYGWLVYMSPSINVGNKSIVFDIRDGNNIGQVNTIQTISTSTWYHVAVTREVGQPLKIYWNGVDTGAGYSLGNVSNIPTYPSTQECSILKVSTGYANSTADELYIYSKVLIPSEVTELYNSSNGKFYPTF